MITQNVDNLHQDAGSADVIEFHGNLMVCRCKKCNSKYNTLDYLFSDISFPPHCNKENCGGILKPEAVLFGEGIPSEANKRANKAAKECDLLMVIGTSASVSPANSIPSIAMKNGGAKIIEINLEETECLTDRISDYFVQGGSSDVLSELAELLSSSSTTA